MPRVSDGAIQLLATIKVNSHTGNVWRKRLSQSLAEQKRLRARSEPKSISARIRLSDAVKRAKENEIQAREGIDKSLAKIGQLRTDFAVEANELDQAGYLFNGTKGKKVKLADGSSMNVGKLLQKKLSQRKIDQS